MTTNKKPKDFLTQTIMCDNIGSTRDGMLPVSCQEQAASVSYPRAMGSLIQTEIKQKIDIYNEWKANHGLRKIFF